MSISPVSRTCSAFSTSAVSAVEDEYLSEYESEEEEEEIGEIEFDEDGQQLWLSEELDEDDSKRMESIRALDLEKPLKLTRSLDELLEPELYVTLCRKLHVVPIANYKEKSIANEFDVSLRALDYRGVFALSKALELNTCVMDLNLSQNCIDGIAARYLVNLMKHNFFISNLDLSRNNLNIGGAEHICEMLRTALAIKSLNLSSNNLQEEHIRIILPGLQENKTIEVLNLSRNTLCNEGAIVLGRGLGQNTNLKCLDLSWNEIYGKGASLLISALTKNATLQIMKLAYNGYRDDNTPAISTVIKNNSVLNELDFTANRITSIGANRIANGLSKNETIHVLRLAKNPIGPEAALQLLESGKKTLKELDLSGVLVSKEFLTATRYARLSREFELVVKYGWPIRGIHNTKSTKRKEARKSDHPLELIRNALWEKCFDIKEIFIKANGPISKSEFILLFTSSDCGIDDEEAEKLYDVLKEEEGTVNIDVLLKELEGADEDLKL